MVTCKECKWWGKNDPNSRSDAVTAHLSFCGCPKFKIGYHYDNDDIAADEVQVEGDEGWGFVTGPDFGCVHGEQK